jgi:tRNA U34 5-carboxymethylaminomethyl modifying enzyme MnmG/GidA
MTKHCKVCNCILNSDEKHSNKCFFCYSEYVKNNCCQITTNDDTNKIIKNSCQLSLSYFSNYNSNSEHIYCPFCDEYLMTYSYITKHVKTPKHALNVERLNNFLVNNDNIFTNKDRELIDKVLKNNTF